MQESNKTSVYSFFSNSSCNKFIFISSNYELKYPANLLLSLNVKYEDVKKFITRKFEMENICKFSPLTEYELQALRTKSAVRDSKFDFVSLSNETNNPNKQTDFYELIDYFKVALETAFPKIKISSYVESNQDGEDSDDEVD